MESYDIIVIGQGYAGLSAAKLAGERGLKVASIEGNCMGGLILNINELKPATEAPEQSGAELASSLLMSIMDVGAEVLSGVVTSVEQGDTSMWTVRTETEEYSAANVLVASGARLRKLGIPGELEYFGRGVSECADCDGPMFAGMTVVVVGGGDSAFQEALALSHFANEITILMRGDGPRARAEFVEHVSADPRITRRVNCRLLAINGDDSGVVTGVRIATPDGEETMRVSGVFIFIGLVPNTDFLPSLVDRDETGALLTSESGAASLPGLWAVGAVRSGYGGLLTDAALDAERAVNAIA